MALLTTEEHAAMSVTGDLASRMRAIIGEGPTAANDILEMVTHIHALQQMIMAQAAARAYPEIYRLLGGTL